ncbi:MAG: cell wall-binding repeat-containing protein [Clostridioides sp.]|nr:cell wall-binding repeat-containing protein [Clostridioides sp.]
MGGYKMNKKNLAVVMTAATVATSVAPVFADTTVASLDGQTVGVKDTAKIEQLKKEVKELLDTKYSSKKDLLKTVAAKSSVFEIRAAIGVEPKKATATESATGTLIDSASKLNVLIAQLEESKDVNKKLYVKAFTNTAGYVVSNGEVLDNKEKKLTADDMKIEGFKADKVAEKINGKVAGLVTADSNAGEIILKARGLASPIVLKEGATTIVDPTNNDFSKDQVVYAKDSYGNWIDENNKKVNTEAEAAVKSISAYKFDLKESEKDFKSEIAFTISNSDVVNETAKASDLYDYSIDRFSAKGNEVFKFIKDYAEVDHVVATMTEADELKLTVPEVKDDIVNPFTTLTITGTANELKTLATALNGKYAEYTNIPNYLTADVKLVDGKMGLKRHTLAGMNRMQTAVEISKELSAKNVVLVSGYNNADGLAATPFAAANDASILLSDKDSIPADVMKEIKAIKTANVKAKVYLVGGVNSLSAKIAEQLEVAGMDSNNVVRIAGTDRAATSLKLAKEISANPTDLFVANGKAEADAMSSAAIAANEDTFDGAKGANFTPILLTNDNGLTEEQSAWLNKQTETTKLNNIYAVGGATHLSDAVLTSLEGNANDVTRLAGANRQATNAAVLHAFYNNKEMKNTEINKIFVAKSDDKGLVDALSAGVLAGKEKAPLVLASESLQADQVGVMKSHNKFGFQGYQTQVGYNVNVNVWSTLENIILGK